MPKSSFASVLSVEVPCHEMAYSLRQRVAMCQHFLAFQQQTGDRAGAGLTLNNLGLIYQEQGKYGEAAVAYEQALHLHRHLGLSDRERATLTNLGNVQQQLGQYAQALEYYQQALALYQAAKNQDLIGRTLNHMGTLHRQLGQNEQAFGSYQQALGVAQAKGDRELEQDILANIGALFAQQQQMALAIVFYKQSVNLTQTTPQELRDLSKGKQTFYIRKVTDIYRALADLLLKQDRVIEAQQILDLLKIQELQEYLHNVHEAKYRHKAQLGNKNKELQGKLQSIDGLNQPVEFLRPETELLQKFEAKQKTVIELGQELSQLRSISEPIRTVQQTQRIAQLEQLQESLHIQFSQFINSPEVQTLLRELSPRALRQTVDLADLDQLRGELRRLNAVLLYPLILDDRLELVITTPDSAPLRRTVKITRQELSATILEFHTAISDPSQTTKTKQLAQKLYFWLIQPLKTDLKQAKVKTIIYAPDGQLRYIPLAALHDGNQWLVQRYQINNITAKSLMGNRFTAQPTAQPRVLAGAILGEDTQYTVKERGIALPGLRYAKTEVASIAATLPKATTQLLGKDFSLQAVKPRMNDYSILHFATHAAFVPGDPSQSFILFGDSKVATLQDIQAGWSLNVDLVVLSACQTAIGGKLGNGEEILGLGYVFQDRGARATVASLWSVQDDSTVVLMDTFYAALRQGFSKAAALRQAQIALIKDGNYNHPLYWAPFILIGNGL